MREITLFLFSFVLTLNLNVVFSTSKVDILRQKKFPPCKACKVFIDSFKKGMEKTAKGKFEGGDTAWEEEKLGSYANSEVRLVETQELVCSDVEEGREQCYSLHEQYDTVIEEWWLNHQTEQPDLYTYFCIKTVEHCCPDYHYGKYCTPCPGFPGKVCNNSGKCKGDGTRKGNGNCVCDAGYTGTNCDSCAEKYFEAYRDDKKSLCSPCHPSCDGPCTKAGPTGCEKCTSGWVKDEEKGCLDINECAGVKPVCSPLQFCVNNDGGYRCLDCDRSCAGCTGDGPDMCIRCTKGFAMKDNICIDSEQEDRKQHVFLTRYLTYLGLCIATCIILQRNVALAAVIGLAVAVYISVSEYMLNTPATPNATDFADKLLRQTN